MDFGASEVAALVTHASLPSSSRTLNQFPLSSRIEREVPFLTFPVTLELSPGPSRRLTESHKILVVRRGGGGVGTNVDGRVVLGGSETGGEAVGGAGLGGGS